MDIRLPQEFVLRSEICAIQLFGRNLLECLPTSTVVLAERPSTHTRMFEVLWKEKRYIVFQRDLEELAEPRQLEQERLPPSGERGQAIPPKRANASRQSGATCV
jgi:hypothetical protein